MAERSRVAFIGCLHDYVWVVANHIKRLGMRGDTIDVVAVAEPIDRLRNRLQDDLAIPRAYTDYRELLGKEKVDIAVVCVENNRHPEVVIACAERGIHTIMDKPMASTLEGARRMMAAAKANKVHMQVDIPIAWFPEFRYAEQLVRDGWLGNVFEVQYRAANMGPVEIGCDPAFTSWLFDAEKNGGGALVDYVTYGALVTRWYLKANPLSVASMGGTFVKPVQVEDNAAMLMQYPKALGIARGAWGQQGFQPPDGPFVLGEKGTIVVERPAQHGSLGVSGWRSITGQVRVYLKGWSDWLTYTPPEPPVGMRAGIEHLVWCVQNNQPLAEPVDEATNYDVQKIVEAGMKSLNQHVFVDLASLGE